MKIFSVFALEQVYNNVYEVTLIKFYHNWDLENWGLIVKIEIRQLIMGTLPGSMLFAYSAVFIFGLLRFR